jgi:hypothetical protein
MIDTPSRICLLRPVQAADPQAYLYDVIISEGVMLVLVHINNQNVLVLATLSRRPRSRA